MHELVGSAGSPSTASSAGCGGSRPGRGWPSATPRGGGGGLPTGIPAGSFRPS